MYYVQQQNSTWQSMSLHTLGVDAMYQMNTVFGSNLAQTNTLRIVDDAGIVYATKTYLSTSLVLVQFPPIVSIVAALLRF